MVQSDGTEKYNIPLDLFAVRCYFITTLAFTVRHVLRRFVNWLKAMVAMYVCFTLVSRENDQARAGSQSGLRLSALRCAGRGTCGTRVSLAVVWHSCDSLLFIADLGFERKLNESFRSLSGEVAE